MTADRTADGLEEVAVLPVAPERFGELLSAESLTRCERMGAAAKARVQDRFLGPRHLGQYVELLELVLAGVPSPTAGRADQDASPGRVRRSGAPGARRPRV